MEIEMNFDGTVVGGDRTFNDRIKENLIYISKSQMRQVIVYPGEDGYWVTQCPS